MLSCDAALPGSDSGAVKAICDDVPVATTFRETSGNRDAGNYRITRIWTAAPTNGLCQGQSVACTQTITVVDNVVPVCIAKHGQASLILESLATARRNYITQLRCVHTGQVQECCDKLIALFPRWVTPT